MLEKIANEREELARSSAALMGMPVHPLRMGSFHLWMARHLYSFRARQILISNGQQTLGIALPWAIAATLVRPAEKVLSISGDGGFLFSAMELETAVRSSRIRFT
jgi:acetolactate synthase-1/2/3 large subunit